MRIVFDLDDTIQFANYRDYEHATPNPQVVDRIKIAKQQGAEIIISTARGMLSCGGNTEKADKKNRSIIEKWLKRYGIPCDELRFGKPMGDAYIDDKAVNVQEFIDGGAERLTGYSGSEVWRIGQKVQKYAKESDKIAFWYKQAGAISNGLFFVPAVYSYREGNLQIEYISGSLLYKNLTKKSIDSLCDILRQFGNCRLIDNSYNDYLTYIEEKCGEKLLNRFKSLAAKYKKLVEPLFIKGTFCHGDFSTFNIISNGQKYYLIDPCVRRWNTWLLDAAKFRASISGLGSVLGDDKDHSVLVPYFDSHFSDEENLAIQFLELTQYIRVLPYSKSEEDKDTITDLIIKRWF